METRDGRFQFTLRELLALFVVAALLLAVLVPAINGAREAARRATCISNLKQLGLALHSYHDVCKFFPASSDVTRNPDGSIRAIDGWSFLVYLLPYMERVALYDSMDVAGGKPLVEPSGAKGRGRPHAVAADTRLDELFCPSNSNSSHTTGPPIAGWVTNYKAMGATHIESLLVASPQPAVPLYAPDKPGVHPDGACFPGTPVSLAGFMRDGSSHTILAVETMDPEYGVWTVGAECTLVGLPSEQPNEKGEMERPEFVLFQNTYYAPSAYNGRFDEDASPAIQRLKAYTAFDFARSEPGPYVGGDRRNTYGPSSGHPEVVNHLMADGAVRCLSKHIDFVAYLFAINRDGGDPRCISDL